LLVVGTLLVFLATYYQDKLPTIFTFAPQQTSKTPGGLLEKQEVETMVELAPVTQENETGPNDSGTNLLSEVDTSSGDSQDDEDDEEEPPRVPTPPPDNATCLDYGSANGLLTVENQPYFPIGLWGMGGVVPWSQFTNGFNALVDAPWSALPDTLLGEHQTKLFSQVQNSVAAINLQEDYQNIIAWELPHEGYHEGYGYSDAELLALAEDFRQADSCHRPVFLSLSLGQSDRLANLSGGIDMAFVQAGYGMQVLPLKTVGPIIKEVTQAMAGKPVIAVNEISSYQPGRYRLVRRPLTFGELRSVSYSEIVNGARGIFFWSYRHGMEDTSDYGFEEQEISEFALPDSPEYYQAVSNLATELKTRTNLFLKNSPTITAQSSNPEVQCAVFEKNHAGTNKPYVICVNVAQTANNYLDYGGGATVHRLFAQAEATTGELFPAQFGTYFPFETVDLNQDNVNNAPGRILFQNIYTGITNTPRTLNKVKIFFDNGSATGNTFQYAIYKDDTRDEVPDQRIWISDPTPVPTTAGYYDFPLPNIAIEPIKHHFLAIKPTTGSTGPIYVRRQDVRGGARVKDNSPAPDYQPRLGDVPLPPNFDQLFAPAGMAGNQITISGGNFSTYCANLTANNLDPDTCTTGTITNNKIVTEFAPGFSGPYVNFDPYAVHVYRLDN
ncbi:MAG: hypothetical protein AAB589_01750, partial [Patescibacteria group bacterium]